MDLREELEEKTLQFKRPITRSRAKELEEHIFVNLWCSKKLEIQETWKSGAIWVLKKI